VPITLQLTYADGSTKDVRVPLETWIQHHRFAVYVDGSQAVTSVVPDPEHKPPDAGRSNDRVTVRQAFAQRTDKGLPLGRPLV